MNAITLLRDEICKLVCSQRCQATHVKRLTTPFGASLTVVGYTHTHTRALPHILMQMPERRACNNLNETDPMTHMPEYSERILGTVGSVVRHLCPNSVLIRCGAVCSVYALS